MYLACYLLLVAATPCFVKTDEGLASRYDPGLMEATVELRQTWWPTSTTRGLPQDLSPWHGHVASLSCDHIGYTYLIRSKEGDKRWRAFIVSDCAGSVDSFIWMRDNRVLVEFGYVEALKFGMIGRPGLLPIEAIILDRDGWPILPPSRLIEPRGGSLHD